MNVIWEDPPVGRGGGRTAWTAEAAALRSSPGRWGRLPDRETPGAAAGLAWAITHGRLKAFPLGEFETRSSGCHVWVRYTGEQS